MTSIVLLAVLASAGQPTNPDSLRADAAFRQSEWRTAAALYQAIAAKQPQLGMAWIRLGISRQALGEADAAIPAFEKALELNWQAPTATLRLARLHSAKGNVDRAFVYLDQLVPMRAVPLPVLDTITDLATARRDARWKGIADRITALRYPCRTAPETRQFDFWIGDWDVTPWQQPPGPNVMYLGSNRVEAILEHCVLLENWVAGPRGGNGGAGKSINFWDTNRRQWRQVWVADGGSSLDYAGSFTDGAMRFEGWTLAPNGGRVLQRLTFFPVSKDTVRQLFETSSDSGKTWQAGFDGRYVRKP